MARAWCALHGYYPDSQKYKKCKRTRCKHLQRSMIPGDKIIVEEFTYENQESLGRFPDQG